MLASRPAPFRGQALEEASSPHRQPVDDLHLSFHPNRVLSRHSCSVVSVAAVLGVVAAMAFLVLQCFVWLVKIPTKTRHRQRRLATQKEGETFQLPGEAGKLEDTCGDFAGTGGHRAQQPLETASIARLPRSQTRTRAERGGARASQLRVTRGMLPRRTGRVLGMQADSHDNLEASVNNSSPFGWQQSFANSDATSHTAASQYVTVGEGFLGGGASGYNGGFPGREKFGTDDSLLDDITELLADIEDWGQPGKGFGVEPDPVKKEIQMPGKRALPENNEIVKQSGPARPNKSPAVSFIDGLPPRGMASESAKNSPSVHGPSEEMFAGFGIERGGTTSHSFEDDDILGMPTDLLDRYLSQALHEAEDSNLADWLLDPNGDFPSGFSLEMLNEPLPRLDAPTPAEAVPKNLAFRSQEKAAFQQQLQQPEAGDLSASDVLSSATRTNSSSLSSSSCSGGNSTAGERPSSNSAIARSSTGSSTSRSSSSEQSPTPAQTILKRKTERSVDAEAAKDRGASASGNADVPAKKTVVSFAVVSGSVLQKKSPTSNTVILSGNLRPLSLHPFYRLPRVPSNVLLNPTDFTYYFKSVPCYALPVVLTKIFKILIKEKLTARDMQELFQTVPDLMAYIGRYCNKPLQPLKAAHIFGPLASRFLAAYYLLSACQVLGPVMSLHQWWQPYMTTALADPAQWSLSKGGIPRSGRRVALVDILVRGMESLRQKQRPSPELVINALKGILSGEISAVAFRSPEWEEWRVADANFFAGFPLYSETDKGKGTE
ncbi:hypothetical protein Efla_004177 [Eimeria flavescens]